ncbi:MAG TPA: hypothetical protein VHR86_03100, partial [Armatimonadota bacterium]|nr:hypothetical protein [Armatimonadota bacterium]
MARNGSVSPRSGGRVGKFSIQNGKFDFWVDDRFADKTNPGFAYYDTITLIPALSEKQGVANGNFTLGRDFGGSGWSWFSRDNTGGTGLAPEGKDGSRCARVEYSGEKDWAVTNSGRLNVKPGQTWVATAWMKCRDTASADLCIVALSGGKLLNWNIGSDGVWGNSDWVRVRAVADIPNGCDQIYLRVV